jgi:hypothetical protein
LTHVADRIRLLQGALPLRAFAAEVGVPFGVLGKYLRGEVTPGLAAVVAICAPTGTSVHWLATGEGPRFAADMPPGVAGLKADETYVAELAVRLYQALDAEERERLVGFLEGRAFGEGIALPEKKRSTTEEDGGSRPKAARGRK